MPRAIYQCPACNSRFCTRVKLFEKPPEVRCKCKGEDPGTVMVYVGDGAAETEARILECESQFVAASELAAANGMRLRRCSENHYQLIGAGGWLLNMYPSNQRLYSDRKRRGPFLEVAKPWTLTSVVLAAIDATKGGA